MIKTTTKILIISSYLVILFGCIKNKDFHSENSYNDPPKIQLNNFLNKTTLTYEQDEYDRIKNATRPRKAKSHVKKNKSTADNNIEQYPSSSSRFPCNTWNPSAKYDLTGVFNKNNLTSYSELNTKIVNALKACGIDNEVYLLLNCSSRGFVIITNYQQIDINGYLCSSCQPRQPNNKILVDVVFGKKSIFDYFISLFTNSPGYYRIFAIVVSDIDILSDQLKKQIDAEIINEWENGGLLHFPGGLAKSNCNKNTKIVAYIYEFEISNSGKFFIQESSISGHDHLERSGILTKLNDN